MHPYGWASQAENRVLAGAISKTYFEIFPHHLFNRDMENNSYTPSNRSTRPSLDNRAGDLLNPMADQPHSAVRPQMARKPVSLVPMPEALTAAAGDETVVDVLADLSIPAVPAPRRRRALRSKPNLAANEASTPTYVSAAALATASDDHTSPEDDAFLYFSLDEDDLHGLEDYCKMADAKARIL